MSGTGLYEDVNVTVCGVACPVSSSPDTTSLVCDTPAHSGQYTDSLFSCHNIEGNTLLLILHDTVNAVDTA